jgi:hypothetical protein
MYGSRANLALDARCCNVAGSSWFAPVTSTRIRFVIVERQRRDVDEPRGDADCCLVVSSVEFFVVGARGRPTHTS